MVSMSKRIFVSMTLLLMGLGSYTLSKLFVISRYESLMAGIKGEVQVLIFLFLLTLIPLMSAGIEKRSRITLYFSLYIIIVLSYFFDLFDFKLKLIAITSIISLSIFSGMTSRNGREKEQ